MATKPHIVIEGAIGVGKTTLARLLAEALPAELVLEVFEENPFLGDFYADRGRYAFQTQLFFLLSRFRQQTALLAREAWPATLVSDYMFAKDWLFAHLNLSGDELKMYERVHAILGERIAPPSLVIHLRAPIASSMRRILDRDRPYERQMSPDYIEALVSAYDEYFAAFEEAPILTIDTTSLDFAHDIAARAEVIALVGNALQDSVYQPAFPELSLHPRRVLQRDSQTMPARDLIRDSDWLKTVGAPNVWAEYLELLRRVTQLGLELESAQDPRQAPGHESRLSIPALKLKLAAATAGLRDPDDGADSPSAVH